MIDFLGLKDLKLKNSKDFIIGILSEEWPLSLKKIYNKIKKKYGVSITYQAVFKAAHDLENKKILKYENKKYKLNIEWIEYLKDFCIKTEKYLLDKEHKLDLQGTSDIKFNNIWDFYLFFLDLLESDELTNKKIETICFLGVHIWNPVVLTDSMTNRFKAVLPKYKMFVLGNLNTPCEVLFKKYWESFPNIKVKIGIQCTTGCDVVIFGDYVIHIYYPQNLLELMDSIYNKIKKIEDLDIREFQEQIIFNDKEKINVSIIKNVAVAKQIREFTLSYF